jgi:ureidoglycolate lyase
MTAEPIVVRVKPISAEAFADYGDLLEKPTTGTRQDFAAAIENRRSGARANLALVRCEPFAAGTLIGTLERHAFSTQFFAPLDVDAYLLVVAKDTGREQPNLATISAFRVGAHQAISYHSGTWHAGMATLGRPGTFAVLIHEDGSEADCEFIDLPQKLLVSWPDPA